MAVPATDKFPEDRNRKSSFLPPVRRPRRDWGRVLARLLCGRLALIGIHPLAASAPAALVDLDIDGARALATELDIDLTIDDTPKGSELEVKLRGGGARFKRSRILPPDPSGSSDAKVGKPDRAVDDDALCGIDAR